MVLLSKRRPSSCYLIRNFALTDSHRMFIQLFTFRYTRIYAPPRMCSSQQPPIVRRSPPRPPQVSRRGFCRLLFALPSFPVYAGGTSSEYDRFASSYETLDGLTHLTKLLGFDDLRVSLLSHAYGEVLELAAGTGINFGLYPPTIVSLTALDASPGMLKVASSRVSNSYLRIPATNCIVGDASNTGLRSSSFDTVVVTFGLCVFDDPEAVLQEVYRLLKPSGTLLVLDYSKSSFSPLSAYQSAVAPVVTHLSKGCVPNRDLPQLFSRTGFVVVKREAILGGIVAAFQLQPDTKLDLL